MGSWFRVRALISFQHAPNLDRHVEAVEHMDYIDRPTIAIEDAKATSIDRLEGGWVVPYRRPLVNVHKLTVQRELTQKHYAGGAATNGQDVILRDITFFTPDGTPTLGVQVPGHTPFDLSWSSTRDQGDAIVEVTEAGERREAAVAAGSVQDNVGTIPNVERFGLRDSRDLKKDLGKLYCSLIQAFGVQDGWQR